MNIKQTERALYPSIQSDGCLLMSLLDIACAEAKDELMPYEINRIYDYAVSKYMLPTCYVLDHAAIIKLGFYLLGHRFTSEYYGYRRDDNKNIFGEGDSEKCNYWIAKVDTGSFEHFYRSDSYGCVLYNPGTSTGRVISLRGYFVKILGEG